MAVADRADGGHDAGGDMIGHIEMNDEGRVGGEGLLMQVFLAARRLAQETSTAEAHQWAPWTKKRYDKASWELYNFLKSLEEAM